jgi:uncharacterized repeat protein (TIGR02543 family)
MYVNGVYEGLFDLRERENASLIESNMTVDNDNVEIVKDDIDPEFDVGPQSREPYDHFVTTRNFIANNDMSQAANYAQAKSMIDVDSLAHEWALNFFTANLDWPQRNTFVWRSVELDNRWRWRPRDMDYAFGLPQNPRPNPPFASVPATIDTNLYQLLPGQGSVVIRSLLNNPEFRNRFINVVADQLNSTLRPAYLNARLDLMAAEMRPYIPDFMARLNNGLSLATWESEIEAIRTFGQARVSRHDSFTQAHFSLPARQPINLGVSAAAAGGVTVNTLNLATHFATATAWTGDYYPGVPMTLTAQPKPGYVFVGWQGASTATTREITVTLDPAATTAPTYTAMFQTVTSNPAPSVQPVANETWTAGTVVRVPVIATDASGLDLTYSATALPRGVTLHPTSGVLYGKPATPGTYSMVITVRNGSTSTVVNTTWTVVNKAETQVAGKATAGVGRKR